ncbi:hypothetical protein [Dactylosporangium sp. NPDC049140]|uniref:hypothetical protein n=1 Tax=Dactylosporangium sp. NPDC049140 TaxID=3155647 RepID=UPI0033C8B119
MAITAFDRPGSGRAGSRPPDVPDGCGALRAAAREPVAAVLAAALLEPLAESARRRCDAALDGIVAAGPPADLRDRLGLPLAAGTVADLLGAPAHRQAPLLAWVRGDLSGEELLAALRHLIASPDVLDNGLLIHCIRGIRAGALDAEELVRAATALLATAPALADRLIAALTEAAPTRTGGPEELLGAAPVRLVTEIAGRATARRLPGLAPVPGDGRLVTWAEARR